jgi:hypothetical protein
MRSKAIPSISYAPAWGSDENSDFLLLGPKDPSGDKLVE